MELILDLVLEYVDMSTLVDCVFLNKHVHSMVMPKLLPVCNLMTELSYMLKDDMYQGIGYLCGVIDTKRIEFTEYENAVMDTIECNEGKYEYQDLFQIYTKLYPFNVDTKAPYIKHATVDELCTFMDDFTPLINKYYYKMPKKLIGAIIFGAFEMGQYADVMDDILNKGFNINEPLRMIVGSKITILNYAIIHHKFWLVDILLDKKPDLYVYDGTGNRSVDLIKPYNNRRKYAEDYLMLHILDRVDALKAEQKGAHSVWI
jgi:hypothetical protein